MSTTRSASSSQLLLGFLFGPPIDASAEASSHWNQAKPSQRNQLEQGEHFQLDPTNSHLAASRGAPAGPRIQLNRELVARLGAALSPISAAKCCELQFEARESSAPFIVRSQKVSDQVDKTYEKIIRLKRNPNTQELSETETETDTQTQTNTQTQTLLETQSDVEHPEAEVKRQMDSSREAKYRSRLRIKFSVERRKLISANAQRNDSKRLRSKKRRKSFQRTLFHLLRPNYSIGPDRETSALVWGHASVSSMLGFNLVSRAVREIEPSGFNWLTWIKLADYESKLVATVELSVCEKLSSFSGFTSSMNDTGKRITESLSESRNQNGSRGQSGSGSGSEDRSASISISRCEQVNSSLDDESAPPHGHSSVCYCYCCCCYSCPSSSLGDLMSLLRLSEGSQKRADSEQQRQQPGEQKTNNKQPQLPSPQLPVPLEPTLIQQTKKLVSPSYKDPTSSELKQRGNKTNCDIRVRTSFKSRIVKRDDDTKIRPRRKPKFGISVRQAQGERLEQSIESATSHQFLDSERPRVRLDFSETKVAATAPRVLPVKLADQFRKRVHFFPLLFLLQLFALSSFFILIAQGPKVSSAQKANSPPQVAAQRSALHPASVDSGDEGELSESILATVSSSMASEFNAILNLRKEAKQSASASLLDSSDHQVNGDSDYVIGANSSWSEQNGNSNSNGNGNGNGNNALGLGDKNSGDLSANGNSWLDSFLNVGRIFIMGAIIVGDICGNSLVILSVCRHTKLRVTTNWFVVSLACADILVALFAMTFSASHIIRGKWLFQPWVCDFWNSCDVLASTASILHLCCISIDRYIAIMRPLDYAMKITTKRVMYALCGVWISSALLSYIPIFTGIYTTSEHIQWRINNPDQCEFTVNRVYAIVSSSISFWIPACIMVFTYYRIYREATRQEKFIYKAQSMAPAPMINHKHHHHTGNHSSAGGRKQRRSKSVSTSSAGSSRTNRQAGPKKQQQQQPQQQQQQQQIPKTSERSQQAAETAITKINEDQTSEKQPLAAATSTEQAGSGAAGAGSEKQQLEIHSGGLARTTTTVSASASNSNNNNNNNNNNKIEEEDEDDDKESNSGQSTPTKRSISKMKREHKAAKTLGIIMGVFVLCWLPFFSWYTPMHICGRACDGIIPHQAVTILFWIGYFNSTLNPIIYAYFNHEFRDAFKKTLQWIFCCCQDLKCLRVNRANDNHHYNCTYRSTQEIVLVSNG